MSRVYMFQMCRLCKEDQGSLENLLEPGQVLFSRSYISRMERRVSVGLIITEEAQANRMSLVWGVVRGT